MCSLSVLFHTLHKVCPETKEDQFVTDISQAKNIVVVICYKCGACQLVLLGMNMNFVEIHAEEACVGVVAAQAVINLVCSS